MQFGLFLGRLPQTRKKRPIFFRYGRIFLGASALGRAGPSARPSRSCGACRRPCIVHFKAPNSLNRAFVAKDFCQQSSLGTTSWYLPGPCLVGDLGEDEIAMQPLYSRRSPTPTAEKEPEVAASHLGGPKEGGMATQPLHSLESPTPTAGRKSELAASPLISQAPRRGRIATQPLHYWRSRTSSVGRK